MMQQVLMAQGSGLLSTQHSQMEETVRKVLPHCVATKTRDDYSSHTRALGAHFLLATNAHHLTKAETEEEFDQLMERQMRDMRLAWSLLSGDSPNSAEEQRALDVMRIQVAQCLKDANLMLPIFERMAKQVQEAAASTNGSSASSATEGEENSQTDEIVLLFTTAPLLGRWAQTVRFGDLLTQVHHRNLSDFHSAPMDYGILYDIAKEMMNSNPATPDAPLRDLEWRQYRIIAQRIRMVDIDAESDDVRHQLLSEFEDADGRNWKHLGITPRSRLVRCGALCQLRSFSPVPLALVGPATHDSIVARGYLDMETPPARQTENYALKRVTRRELQGTLTEQQWIESCRTDAQQLLSLPQSETDPEARAHAAMMLRGHIPSQPEDAPGAIYWRGHYEMLQEPIESGAHDHHEHSHSDLDSSSSGSCCSAGNVPVDRLRVRFEFEMVTQPVP